MVQPGSQPPLSPEAAALQAQLAAVHQHPSSAFDHLNADFSFDEIADVLCSLPTGKAADLQHLTCELLWYPALEALPVRTGQPRDVDGSGDHADPQSYIFEPLIRCVAWIVDQISQQNLSESVWPRVLQLCKLIPVPKSGQASEPSIRNLYRGIRVSSIYSRVMSA
jgi:hypothetical protein